MPAVDAAAEHIQKMMRWHFSEETGSPFWLSRRERLGFDPLTDIRTIDDILQFPNLVDELRDVPIEHVIPRGLGPAEKICAVYDSGGTSGAPKRFAMFENWFTEYMSWENAHYPDDVQGHLLALGPTGPHMLGDYSRRIADAHGGVRFAIDLDPRWVKQLISSGHTASANDYVEHLVDQAELVLSSQNIAILVATPPLLVKLAERRTTRSLITDKVRLIIWTGAHMDLDTLDYLSSSVFPHATIRGSYGSTTVLSGTIQRADTSADVIFDSYTPYVFYRVVDPHTRQVVDYGQEGAVVMNFVTKYGLVPNSLERDIATRVRNPTDIGDSLQNIHPMAEMNGKRMIEGVY